MRSSHSVALTKYVQPAVAVSLYVDDQPKTIASALRVITLIRVIRSNQLYKVAYVCVAAMVKLRH